MSLQRLFKSSKSSKASKTSKSSNRSKSNRSSKKSSLGIRHVFSSAERAALAMEKEKEKAKHTESSISESKDFISRFLTKETDMGNLDYDDDQLSMSKQDIVDSTSWLINTIKVLMGEYDVRDSIFNHFTNDHHYALYIGDELQGGVKVKGAKLKPPPSLDIFGKKIHKVKTQIYFTLVDQANVGDPSHYVGHVYNPNAPSEEGDGTDKVVFILDPAAGKNGKYPIFGENAEQRYSEEVLVSVADQENFLTEAAENDIFWELVPKASAPQFRWYDPKKTKAQRGDTFCQTWSLMLMIAFNEGITPQIAKYTNNIKATILTNFYKYIYVNVIKDDPSYMDMFFRTYYQDKYNGGDRDIIVDDKQIEEAQHEVMYLLHNLTPQIFVRSQSWSSRV